MRFKLFRRKVKGPSIDTRIDARDHQFTTGNRNTAVGQTAGHGEIIYKSFKRRKLKTCVNEPTDKMR